MPPKADTSFQNDILADCIAVLMATGGLTSVSRKQYEMMSSINGERTASSFEHQFRNIVAKSKELKQRLDDGEVFPAVSPAKKRSGNATTLTPNTPKKRKVTEQNATPSMKSTPKTGRAKQNAQVEEEGFGTEGLPVDAGEFIKEEKAWENGFV